MTVSNANIPFDSFNRPYVEEVENIQQNTKAIETQKQKNLVSDDEITFNRKRLPNRSEAIDNAKFKTTAAFNSRSDCSPSGYVRRFAKSMHDKLTGG